MLIGYARVSSTGQSLEVQHMALKAAGCEKVFQEKISGAKSDRAELLKAITKLKAGDVLVVTRLDRLARSTLDLLRTIDQINKAGSGFKSLADAWCDTTTPHGRLMLTVLGGLAEFERSLILERTTAGRQLARQRGTKFGRPSKLSDYQRQEALARIANGERQADIARSYKVSPALICVLAKESIGFNGLYS